MKRAMTLRQIAGFMCWRLLPATVVLTLAAGAGYYIRRTPPMYSQSATVVFTVRDAMANSHLSGVLISPLIATEVMLTQVLMSPAAQHQVRAAGGNAQFDLAPINLYSMEYPEYSEPSATLTTASQRPADVERTFRVVLRLLADRLAAIQARAGVAPRSRIRTFLVGATGPVVQPGSSTRVFAVLGVLAVVALFTVAGFLDRRRRRTA